MSAKRITGKKVGSRKPSPTEIAEIKRLAGLAKEPLAKAKKLLLDADRYAKFSGFPKPTSASLVSSIKDPSWDERYWDIENPELVLSIYNLVKDWHMSKAKAARDEAENILKTIQI